MLELALLAVIGVWLCRRRGWGRAELERAVREVGRWGRSALGATHRTGPGLLAQCAADVRALMLDFARLLPSRARNRIARGVRGREGRPVPHPARSPARDRIAAPAGIEADDPAIARLQRRYIEGRISLEEYVEAARALGAAGP